MRLKCCEECGFRKSISWDDYFKSWLCDWCSIRKKQEEGEE